MNEGTAHGPAAEADADMAELARLADELVDEIGATRRHYDELRATLDGDAPQAAEQQDDGATAAVAVADPPEQEAREEEPDDDDSPPSAEGARLVALNLALMGIDREDARVKLCDGFEIEPDTVDEILDEAFGVHERDRNGRSSSRRRFRRHRNGDA
jgi:hypothetical protein